MRGRKRRNDIDSSEFENVVSLYKNKISLKQIAFDYDVTAYVVRDVLVGMGVEIGPRGRPWKQKPIILKAEADYYGADVRNEIQAKAAIENNLDRHLAEAVQDDNEIDLFDLGDFRRPLGE